MRFDYATRDENKAEAAKEEIRRQAQRAGQTIVGFHTFKTALYPLLQTPGSTKGVMHTIIWGFTSQTELDDAKAS